MLDLDRIDQILPKRVVELRLDADRASQRGTQQIAHAAHQLVQINLRRCQRLLPRKGQQAPYQVCPATRGLQYHREAARVYGFVLQVVVQHLRVAADRDQEVVEVMGDA